jgi:hypothetical protein
MATVDDSERQARLELEHTHIALLEARAENARLRVALLGMVAAVGSLDRDNLWFSRSRAAVTLIRDSLRTWADEANAALAPAAAGAAEGQG